jgi:DNA invertase Pin-like site-specific DNA recombinase
MFFFSIMGVLARFERGLIRERTNAGLAAAGARGRVGGRPPVMTAQKVEVARQMYDSKEHTVKAIAHTLGVSRKTIYRHLAPNGLMVLARDRGPWVRSTPLSSSPAD